MKRLFQKLSSWWLATMVPVRGPLTTIDARETLRKRHLFSYIILITLLGMALFTLQGIFLREAAVQMTINFMGCGESLLALWINQRGYLRSASLLHFFYTFLAMVVTINALVLMVPYLSLSVWVMLLLLPVAAGLFLAAWGPLLLGAAEVTYMYWFMQYGYQSQIATYLSNPYLRQQGLNFSYIIILVITVFSAVYATTTKKAVIRADRAIELEQTHQELSMAYTELELTHTHLEVAHATIQKQALTDALTGLPNHRAVMDQFSKEIERAYRYDHPLSVLFFDADRFKKVNDTYGHAAGDVVLRQIGERTGNVLREGDTLGRFGGEEFVILLPEADAREAGIIAERIRVSVANGPVATSEVEGGILMTVSIGLSTLLVDGTSEQELLTHADEAMYVAKQLGRNQVRTSEEARQIGKDVELMVLMQQNRELELAQREGPRPEQLRETYTLNSIYSLMALLEERDTMLSMHSHAVSDLATALAQEIGLEPDSISRIGMAALVHDIGKVAVPDGLLQKADALTTNERELLRKHAELGAQILGASPLLYDLMPAVRHHHERWDGSGYPDQLAGEDIPLAARIIAVAEAYDAMQSNYPYQTHRSPEEAMIELQRCAGSQFDPSIVQALQNILLTSQKLLLVG